MKILQVTPRYLPQSGGVETHVKELSERFAERGHDVTVVTADARNEGEHREQRNGVSVRRYRSIAPNGTMHLCPQIATVVRRSDAEIIHAHNFHSLPLFFAALGIDNQKLVVTTHYHGSSASPIRDQLLSLYRIPGQWAVQRADEVIAVSDWEKEQVRSDLGVDATVIPNGISSEKFAEAEPFVWDRPYLLTVGRLEKYKGVQHTVRAIKELSEYDLLVAGTGPNRKELERIAREVGVEDQVEFLGYVADEDLPGLYAGAEAFITLSEFEAYGLTVAEALASGTPCVVRNTGGLQDWAGSEGVISLTETSPDAIVQAIKTAESIEASPASYMSWERVTTLTLQKIYED